MNKRQAKNYQRKLKHLYPLENITIFEITRGDWGINIPNNCFTPVYFKDSGVESTVRLKTPTEYKPLFTHNYAGCGGQIPITISMLEKRR